MVDLGGYIIILTNTDGRIKLYGSPADNKEVLEVGDEILEVNGRTLENASHAEVIQHIHQCIKSRTICLRVKRRSGNKMGFDGANIGRIQDAWVIAVERDARERLQSLTALRRIQPRDIQTILHQQLQTVASTSGVSAAKDVTSNQITVTLPDKDLGPNAFPKKLSNGTIPKGPSKDSTVSKDSKASPDRKDVLEKQQSCPEETNLLQPLQTGRIAERRASSPFQNGRTEVLIGEPEGSPRSPRRSTSSAVIDGNFLNPPEERDYPEPICRSRRRSASGVTDVHTQQQQQQQQQQLQLQENNNSSARDSLKSQEGLGPDEMWAPGGLGHHRELPVDVPDTLLQKAYPNKVKNRSSDYRNELRRPRSASDLDLSLNIKNETLKRRNPINSSPTPNSPAITTANSNASLSTTTATTPTTNTVTTTSTKIDDRTSDSVDGTHTTRVDAVRNETAGVVRNGKPTMMKIELKIEESTKLDEEPPPDKELSKKDLDKFRTSPSSIAGSPDLKIPFKESDDEDEGVNEDTGGQKESSVDVEDDYPFAKEDYPTMLKTCSDDSASPRSSSGRSDSTAPLDTSLVLRHRKNRGKDSPTTTYDARRIDLGSPCRPVVAEIKVAPLFGRNRETTSFDNPAYGLADLQDLQGLLMRSDEVSDLTRLIDEQCPLPRLPSREQELSIETPRGKENRLKPAENAQSESAKRKTSKRRNDSKLKAKSRSLDVEELIKASSTDDLIGIELNSLSSTSSRQRPKKKRHQQISSGYSTLRSEASGDLENSDRSFLVVGKAYREVAVDCPPDFVPVTKCHPVYPPPYKTGLTPANSKHGTLEPKRETANGRVDQSPIGTPSKAVETDERSAVSASNNNVSSASALGSSARLNSSDSNDLTLSPRDEEHARDRKQDRKVRSKVKSLIVDGLHSIIAHQRRRRNERKRPLSLHIPGLHSPANEFPKGAPRSNERTARRTADERFAAKIFDSAEDLLREFHSSVTHHHDNPCFKNSPESITAFSHNNSCRNSPSSSRPADPGCPFAESREQIAFSYDSSRRDCSNLHLHLADSTKGSGGRIAGSKDDRPGSPASGSSLSIVDVSSDASSDFHFGQALADGRSDLAAILHEKGSVEIVQRRLSFVQETNQNCRNSLRELSSNNRFSRIRSSLEIPKKRGQNSSPPRTRIVEIFDDLDISPNSQNKRNSMLSFEYKCSEYFDLSIGPFEGARRSFEIGREQSKSDFDLIGRKCGSQLDEKFPWVSDSRLNAKSFSKLSTDADLIKETIALTTLRDPNNGRTSPSSSSAADDLALGNFCQDDHDLDHAQQAGLNGVKPAIPPRDQKRAPARPPKDNLRFSAQNNNVETSDNANANAEPTQQQLHSIRKYQEQLRKRKDEEERQEMLNRSVRGSRKLQALESHATTLSGQENPAYAQDEVTTGVSRHATPNHAAQEEEPPRPLTYGEVVATLERLQLQLRNISGALGISGPCMEAELDAVRTLLVQSRFATALATHHALKTRLRSSKNLKHHADDASNLARDCVEILEKWQSSSTATGVGTAETIAAVEELTGILTSYDMEALLLAHDSIVSYVDGLQRKQSPSSSSPSGPPSPTSSWRGSRTVDNIKIIRIEKTNEPLGATVKNEGGAVIIGRVVRGGAADKSGLLHEGDEVLDVNGVEMRGKSVHEVCDILAGMQGGLTFLVLPAPTNHRNNLQNNRREDTNQIQHIRAHFDYDPEEDPYIPCRELGVGFQKGDVLHVISQEDPNWWQAYREGEEDQILAGLIPSKAFQHQRESMKRRIAGDKSTVRGSKKSSTLLCARKNPKKKKRSKFGANFNDDGYPLYATTAIDDYDSEEVLTYEEVALYYPRADHKRPIVLIGPPNIGRHELRQRLMQDSERFAAAIPHTSRPRKDSEVDGQDYHFISRSQFESDILCRKFVEHGEYEKAYYGTSVEAIRSVVNSGKICVLNLHPQSLKILRSSDLKPYVVFVAPPSLEKLKQKRIKNSESFKEEELKDIIEKAREMEDKYGHLFDMIIINNDTDRAYNQLLTEINLLEREPQWVPTSWVQ